MNDETNYETLLRHEDVTHEQVLEELDDAVRGKIISPEVHRVLMTVLEVACE